MARTNSTAPQRLDELLYDLRAREGLPHSRMRRVPNVIEELLTRRYQNHSNGFYSALKDPLIGSPTEVRE